MLRQSAVLRIPVSHPSEVFGAARRCAALVGWIGVAASGLGQAMPQPAAAAGFHQNVKPLLAKYCYDCHGGGLNKGDVTLDEFASDGELLGKRDLWRAALKNVQAGLMPPLEEGLDRPTATEIATLTSWIKYGVFGTDPQNPDPGRVPARRLNRIEYRNTIRDLLGYDFNSEAEFPSDDSGSGFDNNAAVLTISPLLLEKYLAAAETIVDRAVPKVAKLVRERVATGRDFRAGEGGSNGERLNARQATKVSRAFTIDQADRYRVSVEIEARGSFDFDASRCRLVCRINDEERFTEEIVWSEGRAIRHEFEVSWQPGSQVVSFEVVPLPPVVAAGEDAVAVKIPAGAARAATDVPVAAAPRRQTVPGPTSVTMRIASLTLRGPLSPEHWTVPENYARFFPGGPAPEEAAARDRSAAEVLGKFATRAFRRPVDATRVAQLVGLARQVYALPGKTFEEGVGRAMMAVLGSPRFLFRVEEPEAVAGSGNFAPVDEYALASRLSYFLWSTMPDDELFQLAERGQLRANLRAQVTRLLHDPKAQAFARNFTGQWLQARDVEFVQINTRVALGGAARPNRDGRVEFDSAFRKLMRSETEMYFEHVIREDRSVLELVDSDYAFLNERLAAHYGVPDVTGENLRLVKLPPDSPRGGVLTQGTVLAVTSNPTRTSPVKRGMFILENILGIPPPPAPPNVPDLEESKKEFKDREPKLSEMLAVHRANKLCNSCHSRMDPLGLALENFNAIGGWRDTDARQPIDPAGVLITGERFSDVRELKRVMARDRKMDIYRCLTEKLFTYALGRGVEYYDAHTIDEIVGRLAQADGRMSVLLLGIIESPAFQKQRRATPAGAVSLADPAAGASRSEVP